MDRFARATSDMAGMSQRDLEELKAAHQQELSELVKKYNNKYNTMLAERMDIEEDLRKQLASKDQVGATPPLPHPHRVRPLASPQTSPPVIHFHSSNNKAAEAEKAWQEKIKKLKKEHEREMAEAKKENEKLVKMCAKEQNERQRLS